MIDHRTTFSLCLFILLALSLTNCDMTGTEQGEVTELMVASGDGEITLSWNDQDNGNLDHIDYLDTVVPGRFIPRSEGIPSYLLRHARCDCPLPV